eukprot:GHVR01148093.1.p1 GENE.GHVR01148093.1~~GHVR01148093.1.p1  ORF type:complete len:476 (+),score=81.65 GHVR01148093.1:221-1648(+)
MQPVKTLNDEVIWYEEDEVTCAYLLESGELQRSKNNKISKEEMQLENIKPGVFIGLKHILSDVENECAYCTITCVTDCNLFKLMKEDLIDILNIGEAKSRLIGQLAKIARRSNVVADILQVDPKHSKKLTIKTLCFDSSNWVLEAFEDRVKSFNKEIEHLDIYIDMRFTSDPLSERTAHNAAGSEAVCIFVNDDASAGPLRLLAANGVKLVTLRCAGFDRVDRGFAEALNMTATRVPAYSPYAVAEHGIALLQTLNRRIHRAVNRVKDANYTIDGFAGIDIHGKTVGVLGTGKIGICLCNILLGFGANLVCYDKFPNKELATRKGVEYVNSSDDVWRRSIIVFLMTPLLPETYHLFNYETLKIVQKGVTIINTSRGGLIDTEALLEGLRDGVIAGAGLDVYEHEAGLFFNDMSSKPIKDRTLAELIARNNVILTPHQAFFTKDAVTSIVDTTLNNIVMFVQGKTGRDHENDILKL